MAYEYDPYAYRAYQRANSPNPNEHLNAAPGGYAYPPMRSDAPNAGKSGPNDMYAAPRDWAADQNAEIADAYKRGGFWGAAGATARAVAATPIAAVAEPIRRAINVAQDPARRAWAGLTGGDVSASGTTAPATQYVPDPYAALQGPPAPNQGAGRPQLSQPDFRNLFPGYSGTYADTTTNRFNGYPLPNSGVQFANDIMLPDTLRPGFNRARSDADRTNMNNMLSEAQRLMASGSISGKLRGMRLLKAAQLAGNAYGTTAATDIAAERTSIGAEEANRNRNLQARMQAEKQFGDLEQRRFDVARFGQQADDNAADRGFRAWNTQVQAGESQATRAASAWQHYPKRQMESMEYNAMLTDPDQYAKIKRAQHPYSGAPAKPFGMDAAKMYQGKDGVWRYGYQYATEEKED
jgi:hypothetical protein